MMETVAYYVALGMLIVLPPAIVYWLLIHPFVGLWRKVGPRVTFGTATGVMAGVGAAMFWLREPLLSVRFGVRTPLLIGSALLFSAAFYLGLLLRRQFTVALLSGVPEVQPQDGRQEDGQKLVTEGIYSRIRNPRYVQIGLLTATSALFSNYLAVWILLALYFPAIYLVVLLEERELRDRFGEEFEEYCRRVPRFVPKLRIR